MFKQRLTDKNILMRLFKKYVDDVALAAENIPKGSRLTNGKVQWTQANQDEDENSRTSIETNTMRILQDIANGIFPILQFTSEVSHEESNPVPVLDIQL